ncbi:hypothetical protein [uncultured Methylobacterium sp.]|jgi:hypothetical protein|uniref:hypothetical protein n=1 Tax=uncultured Methylobacterium sp. TaxID=157278 RepID=UPI0026223298|nr:hypothetical protein [uncultured Methylobacterium sp.]
MEEKTINPEKSYRVKLKRSVEISPHVFARPNDDVVVKGRVLETILDDVLSYEEA